MTQPGLRERKKEQTRHSLIRTARRLFAERGFDAVTVADVAAAAEVAETTVFNYFGTKEDLFFDGLEAFEERLIEAVGDRPAGVSVLEAFADMVVNGAAGLASAERAEGAAMAARLIGESPALRRKELEIVADYADGLARLLAEEAGETGEGIEPSVVAHSLMAAHQVLVGLVRSLALGGMAPKELAEAAARQAERAFAVLSDEMARYGRR